MRLRDDFVGTTLNLDDRVQWRQQIEAQVKKRKATPDSAESKAKRAKSTARAPLRATCDWLCALDTSIAQVLGHGLEWFSSPEPDRPFDDDFADNEVDTQHSITFCFDEEQKQLAGYYFLERKLGLACFRLQPPLHRRHNDVMNAIIRAGLYDIVALTIFVRNISFGPWNKSGNMQSLWETGIEMSNTLTPDDVFLLKMWPSICQDKGWTTPEETDRAARERFVASLPSLRPFAVKGPRAAYSKWMSVLSAIEYEAPNSTVKAMGIAFSALRRGLIAHLDELWKPGQTFLEQEHRGMCKIMNKTPAQAVPMQAGSGAASSSGDVTATPEVWSRAKAKAKASATISTLIKRNQNAFLSVGRILGNIEFRSLQEILRVVCEPLKREHSTTVHKMHTRRGPQNGLV